MRKKKNLGIGAKCSTLMRFLHPRLDIIEKYPNASSNQRLEDLLAIKRDQKKVNGKEQNVVIFRHDEFPNKELY